MLTRHISWGRAALLPLLCTAFLCTALTAPLTPARASVAPAGINGFNDPGGFTLNANGPGFPNNPGQGGQSAALHGVPQINGGTLHLTSAQGAPGTFDANGVTYNTFYGSERTSAFFNQPQYVGSFTASFLYQNNGPNPNPQSFGPGDAFIFVVQNDPRGASALGNNGAGYGDSSGQLSGTAIMPSAGINYSLFTGFGTPRGPALVQNGNNDDPNNRPVPSGSVDLASGDPIAVNISYNGTTLSESLVDTVTHAAFSTSYPIDLVSQLGSAYGYVGFTGGTGAAVEDQYFSNFTYSTSVSQTPVNAGPKITVTAIASKPFTGPISGTYRQVNVTSTNTGGSAADMFQITSVTLNGTAPAPVPPSDSPVPTTPNNLSNLPGQNTQQNGFAFSPPAGTKTAILRVSGTYVNAGITSTFTSTIRLSLPMP